MKKNQSKPLSKKAPKVKIVKKRASKKGNPANPTSPQEFIAKKQVDTQHEEQEIIEKAKFSLVQKDELLDAPPLKDEYKLPVKYGDNRLVLMPRDPWWIYTYWDISEEKINEVIDSVPINQRQNFKWIIRVYDVTAIESQGDNAHSSFDVDINFQANNWSIYVNSPEKNWRVEIGFKNSFGRFFYVVRSNIVKTPHFGVSSIVDQEWALPDEEYQKILGNYSFASTGKSSLAFKKI